MGVPWSPLNASGSVSVIIYFKKLTNKYILKNYKFSTSVVNQKKEWNKLE